MSETPKQTKNAENHRGEIRNDAPLRRMQRQTDIEDEALLSRIARSDSAALSRLFEKYQRTIYSLILKIVRSEEDAAEILQDVFLQVWDKAGLFDSDRGSFAAWLTTLSHNKAINLLRSRRHKQSSMEVRKDLEELALIVTEETTERRTALDDETERDERQQMQRILDQIPEAQRTTIVMAYYSGYSQSEIAEALGVPLGTVKTRMRQGMIKLRELLGGRSSENVY